MADAPGDTRFLLPAHGSVPLEPAVGFDPWSGLVLARGLPAAKKALGRPAL